MPQSSSQVTLSSSVPSKACLEKKKSQYGPLKGDPVYTLFNPRAHTSEPFKGVRDDIKGPCNYPSKKAWLCTLLSMGFKGLWIYLSVWWRVLESVGLMARGNFGLQGAGRCWVLRAFGGLHPVLAGCSNLLSHFFPNSFLRKRGRIMQSPDIPTPQGFRV